jgi:hypothetical protein
MEQTPREPGTPYCGECGYDLAGLTDSARCPECGRPLVEVLRRAGDMRLESGKRYRSRATILGMPAIHIAIGPKEGELQGKARGFVAIGDDAIGVLAIGGTARGAVAIGGLAVGGMAIGGMAVGAISALGGAAVALGLAVGGGAVGGIAKGGGAAGYVASGGGALGVYAEGGGAFGRHAVGKNAGASSSEAAQLFDKLDWLLGDLTMMGLLRPVFIVLVATLLVGGLVGLLGWSVHRREPAAEEPQP